MATQTSIPAPPKKDPNGLVKHDLDYLRRTFKKRPYSPKMTHAEIMYEEGKQLVIDFIERDLVEGRRR